MFSNDSLIFKQISKRFTYLHLLFSDDSLDMSLIHSFPRVRLYMITLFSQMIFTWLIHFYIILQTILCTNNLKTNNSFIFICANYTWFIYPSWFITRSIFMWFLHIIHSSYSIIIRNLFTNYLYKWFIYFHVIVENTFISNLFQFFPIISIGFIHSPGFYTLDFKLIFLVYILCFIHEALYTFLWLCYTF